MLGQPTIATVAESAGRGIRARAVRARLRGFAVECGQATLEWTTIAALVVALSVPAVIGLYFASGNMYDSLDSAEDVVPAAAVDYAGDTYNISFMRILMGPDGTVDQSSAAYFGDDWNQSLEVGEAIACPPTAWEGHVFDHWAEFPVWGVPVGVPSMCQGKDVIYVAVYSS